MTTIDLKHLMNAVIASRDEVDPELETDLLEAIVRAEADAAGDGDAAIRAIDAAVSIAIARRGHLQEAEETTDSDYLGDSEGEV